MLNRAFGVLCDAMPAEQVLTGPDGEVVPNVYCIGDANGKMMLAHAASAHGVSAVENICGRVSPHQSCKLKHRQL